ncbi:O-antigen ligase family protein [Algibacter pectinivorans]|uniref:O-antigen ligase n=1 Tax=Algibacter pectinivorans TaxID=870482 RepID=A0A1I1NMI5_9FLAO|nr:O-antigen ligase family protein [Algibacter pectinivorans]SFC95973.1 O-antigen ligase [Algibacter pectinivorans]
MGTKLSNAFKPNNLSVLLIVMSLLGIFFKSNISSITLIILFVFSQINFFIIENKQLKDLKGIFNFKSYYVYFIGYFVLVLLSVLYSTDTSTALKYTIRHVAFIFLPISFFCLPKLSLENQLKIRKVYVYWVAILFTFLLINAIINNHLKGYSLIDFFQARLENLFGLDHEKVFIEYWLFTYEGLTQIIDIQPIYLTLFVNVAFVFLLKLKENNKLSNKLFWFFSFYYLLFVLLLSSRSGLGVFILLFIGYVNFIMPKTNKDRVKGVTITLLFLSIALGVIFTNPILKYRVMSVLNPSEEHKHLNFSNQSIRLIKWKNALEEIKEAPILGHGIGDYKNKLLQRYRINDFKVGLKHEYNAHNQYLDTMLQVGVLGLLVLVLLFFYGLNSPGFEIKFIFGIFLISFITESMFGRHWGVVSFTLFSCFLRQNNDRA